MILFCIAEFSASKKLKLYKLKLDKNQDYILKVLKHVKCILKYYSSIQYFQFFK